MGKHKNPQTLEIIKWLIEKGEEYGFYVEDEYPLIVGEYYADVVWKLNRFQDPLVTFEVETRDQTGIFSNAAKYFGTSSTYVKKPWKHFIITVLSEISAGHKASLHNLIHQHNVTLYENVYNISDEKTRLETELNTLAYNLKEILDRFIVSQPIGKTLPLLIDSIKKGFEDGIIKNPQIHLTVESGEDGGGIKFKIITETPVGEPTIYDRIIESSRTLKPFSIQYPQVKDFVIGDRSVIPDERESMILKITPKVNLVPFNLIIPNSDACINDILIRYQKSERGFDYFSTEDRNLPFKFEFMMNRETGQGSFNLKIDAGSADCVQGYNFEEFIREVNIMKEIRLVYRDTSKVVLSMNFSKGVQQNESWYNLIHNLANIQNKIKKRIPIPEEITEQDLINIHKIQKIIESGRLKESFNNFKLKTSKKEAIKIINLFRDTGYVEGLSIAQPDFVYDLFKQKISLGKCDFNFPKIKLDKSIDDYEAVLEGEEIEIVLLPVDSNSLTLEFTDWIL